jgi:ATP-dependent helicase HrpB
LSLPVADIVNELITQLRTSNAVLIAPPGAGKSTYLPLQLIKSEQFRSKKIVMLQPRRLAARSIAHYLAHQMHESVGQTVGYRIRGERKVSSDTRLEIVTEGILTRMLQQDPELADVDLVIFDEFHERNLHADFSLALCLESQQALRDDLRILVMSATLSVHGLTDYLNKAALIKCEGRQFPIDIRYVSQKRQNQQVLALSIVNLTVSVLKEEQGNVLIFLPSIRLIRELADLLREKVDGAQGQRIHVCPLYGDLSLKEQSQAIEPTRQDERKVVIATNIAETSLTIEGIRIVIDSGLENTATFNLSRGITQVETKRIVKASATQRSGRAGRLEPGVAYRLWSEEQDQQLVDYITPQILNSDITPLILDALVWGTSLKDLALLDQPSLAQYDQGMAILRDLNAVDSKDNLTSHGREIQKLGCHPRIANMLLSSKKIATLDGCDINQARSLACMLAALLEGKDPLTKSQSSDVYLRLQFLKNNKKHGLWRDAKHWAQRFGITMVSDWPLHILSILIGHAYPDHIARLRNGNNYQLSCGSGAALSEEDGLAESSWLVVGKLVLLQGQVNARIALSTPVSEKQLRIHFENLFRERRECQWQQSSKRVEARHLQLFREIVIDKQPCRASSEELNTVWQDKLAEMDFDELPLSAQAKNWVSRINMAHYYSPNEGWPDFSNEGLMSSTEVWLLPYLSEITSWQAFEKLDWLSLLKQFLSYELQQKVEVLLPKSITLPTGRQAKLDYVAIDKVVLSARMQEMYGTSVHPTIANNRLPLVVELLSPRQQPIQITQDIPNFWKSSYQQVRKDMKSQYPKHHWPENPLEAEASLKTNRQLRMQGKL